MFDINEFVWRHFEKFHKDFEEAGQERFNPQKFKREYVNWRFSDMPGKIVVLKKDTELPTGSLLHLCDNFSRPESGYSDLPIVATNPFIQRESFKKFIYHIRDFDLTDPIKLEDKYIYRQAGLPTQFMKFRTIHGSQFRYLNKLDEIPLKKECLPVINHNPLFRAKVMGRLQFFRKTELILTSILNTCCKLAHLNKQQWIIFPWGDEVFERSMFLRSRTALTPATLKRPDNFQWILQMHLLNFMWNDATTSIFRQIPDDVLPQINLILEHNEKYLFYNLQLLKDMNVKNKAYIKFSNQLNLLSILGRIDPEKSSEQVKILLDEAVDKVGVVKTELSEEEQQEAPVEAIYSEETPEKEDPKDDTSDKDEEALKKLDKVIPVTRGFTPTPKISHQIATPPDEPKNFNTKGISPTARVVAAVPNNVTHIKEIEEDSSQISEEYYRDLTNETEQFILDREELTPAQKQRYMKVSKKWEEVQLNGTPLKKLILDNNDLKLDHEAIPEDIIGPIPDTSALKSSLSAFDRDYMTKTYHKQLAGVLTSFQKNGIFLIGIKEEKVVSEMNNYTKYSVQYEDIEGRRSSIRFQIPSVNRRGRVKIDGVNQVLKKQKINLPIVTISDSIVSLSPCQNKTRIERNLNKPHNYFAYIESIVNSPKTTVGVEYGKSIVNLPISYEYASIGERYKLLTFKNGTDKWELYFDYKTRNEHFRDKEELMLGLEKEYGVYFGRNNDSWFFVDSMNQVKAVRMQGGENLEVSQWDSIAGILKLSLNEGESFNKVLTEWCNIKILDAYLPVIFLLGYKFGLRNVLDKLGVQYTVTERRSKIIVGEGNLAVQEGTESLEQMFGANVNNVTSGTDEVIDDVDWIKIAGQEAAHALTYVPHAVPGLAGADTKSNVEIKTVAPEKLTEASLKIPNKPILSTGKILGLDQIRSLGVPNTDLIVGASAAMVLYGIKQDPNRDLDVGISPEWLKKLEDQGLIELVEEDSGLHKILKGSPEKGCEIDFGVYEKDGTPMMPWNGIERGTVVVDGIRFDNIYYLFRFYTWLFHHAKNDFFIEKRTRQLRELSEAVSNWFGHVCYHGSATQGIPYMEARVAPSYRNRGPLVFATYFKHFAMTFGYKWNDDIFKHGWTIAADGLTPIITMEFLKDIKEADLRAPYSIYQLPDTGFKHLLRSEEDPENFGGHPITEIIHSGDVEILKEEYREDWLEDMFQLEKLGLLHLENKDKIQKPAIHSVTKGLKPVDDDIFKDVSVTLDTEVVEDNPKVDQPTIRFVPKETSIPIKFADRILWIDRYPLAHSFIVAGLDNYDLSQHEMSEFESPDVYYSLLQDKNMSINYLKGIDIFFESFMDPITYTTLKMMHEPTTVRGLLIRAVQLLTTLDHLPPSSSKNFKVRGYEQFVAILYNEMARQYATYRKGRGKSNVFSIPEEAVYLRILQNSSMLASEPGGPLKDFTENAYLTHLGTGGRTGESFVVVDRKMARDDTGVMGEATPDNSKVGVNAQLTYDPGISNTLGILDPKPIPELSPANAFSIYSLLFPAATSDDSKRINTPLALKFVPSGRNARRIIP